MKKAKLKILMASALVFMMITPSLEVAAVEVHKNIIQGNANQVGEKYQFTEKESSFVEGAPKYLKLKTNSQYEIALAYSDGSFSYLDKSDSLEEAKNIVNNTQAKVKSGDVESVVINKRGLVVYAENAVAKIVAYRKDELQGTFNHTANLYSTENSNSAYTYINHGYIDDAPVISVKGNRTKIQVSGYKGWIDSGTEDGDFDMIVVPTNQVKSPSYYEVKNGKLYHYISSDITETNAKLSTVVVGIAPPYLKSGVKYLSYDGSHFYDGDNRTSILNKIIADLKNDSYINSVNPNNEYYSYFNRLPFRSKTNYTAKELNEYIEKNVVNSESQKGVKSVLRGTGEALIKAQNKYGVNALLTLGVAINESGWGCSALSQEKNNIFGLRAIDSDVGQADSFYSIESCINNFAKGWISTGYADPQDYRYNGGILGNKAVGANVKYASDPYWGEKAAQHALNIDLQLSGDNINNMKDYNAYQLAIFTENNEVRKANNEILYKVSSQEGRNLGYPGTSLILINNDEIAGANNISWYEMYPERNTPVSEGEFNNDYNWNDKGYVKTNGIKFINNKRNGINPSVNSDVNVDANQNVNPDNKEGWQLIKGKYYFYKNGQLKKGWHLENNKWYFLDKQTGGMATGLYEVDGKKYYSDGSGAMLTGWIKLSNGEYYYAEAKGNLKTGWLQENSKWYYLKPQDNKLATGWYMVGSTWYYSVGDGTMQTGWQKIKDKWYLLDKSGAMLTGWQKDNNKWYFLEASGEMKTGWLKEGSNKYYLKDNGEMLTDWQTIDDKKYYFEPSGNMKTGWVKTVSGKYYYFRASGEMPKGWELVSGRWYFMDDTGIMQTGWLLKDGVWYYLESSGEMATGWKKVSGEWYYLYDSGKMAVNTVIDGWKIGSNGVAKKL